MAEDLHDIGEDRTLLLVDDDDAFLKRLAKAMEKRGFEVEMAGSVAAGKAIATARPPAFAVCDLRLEDGNGLDVVEVLREKRPDCRIVVLTGYGAIATAVAAVTPHFFSNCFASSAASTTVNFDKFSMILFKSAINFLCRLFALFERQNSNF